MRRVSIFIGMLVFLISGSPPIMAVDIYTLEKSIEIAVEKSLSVLSADEEIRAKEFEERAAQADFYPKLSTGYTYTRIDSSTVDDAKATTYVYNPITGTHVPRQISPISPDNYSWDLTAAQPLFTGWRLTLARDLASLGVNIAQIQKETTVQDLVLEVKKAYFGILKAGGIVIATNPLYTERELTHQLADCGAETVFVMTLYYDLLKKVQATGNTAVKRIIVTNIKEYLSLVPRILFTLFKERRDGHSVRIDAGDQWLSDLLERYQKRDPFVLDRDVIVLEIIRYSPNRRSVVSIIPLRFSGRRLRTCADQQDCYKERVQIPRD